MTTWATHLIAELRAGEVVPFQPRGSSMVPKIRSGDLVTVRPLPPHEPEVGNVVLCHVAGRDYLHLVRAIEGERYQIGNSHGHVNGWTSRERVFGRAIEAEGRKL